MKSSSDSRTERRARFPFCSMTSSPRRPFKSSAARAINAVFCGNHRNLLRANPNSGSAVAAQPIIEAMKNPPLPQYKIRPPRNSFTNLNRRRFLRGLGACMALPAFGSLEPMRLLAAITAARQSAGWTRIGRLSFMCRTGSIPISVVAARRSGADFHSGCPPPCSRSEKLRNQIQLISGLLQDLSANPFRRRGRSRARGRHIFDGRYASRKPRART